MLPWVIVKVSIAFFFRLILISAAILPSIPNYYPKPTLENPGNFQSLQISNANQQQDVDFRFEHIGIQDGLSMSTIQTIAQDKYGYLWIGTNVGLNRYDGFEITIHSVNPGAPNPLIGEQIRTLYSDSQDNLWVGTDLGLVRIDSINGELHQYRARLDDRQSLSQGPVNSIIEDASGDLWIGTANGLSRFNPDTQTFTRLLFENNIFDLYIDDDGLIWIASNLGLLTWQPDNQRFSIYQTDDNDPTSISNNFVTAVEGDSAGNLWIGTVNGLNLLDTATGKFKRFTHNENDANSLAGYTISDILADSQDRIWVGLESDGLDLYDPAMDGFHHFQNDPAVPSSLSDDLITALYEDQSGVIWIGTLTSGLNKLSDNNNRFHLYPSLFDQSIVPEQQRLRASLHNTVINDLFSDENGNLWIGTILNGLYHQDHKTGILKQFTPGPSVENLSGLVVNEIFEDHSGQLWIGTDRALNKFDPNSGIFEDIPTFNRHSIFAIAEDKNSDLWVASSGGLFRLFTEGNQLLIEKITFADQEPSINDIMFDTQDSLWIATENGLFVRFSGQSSFTHFSPDPENPGSMVGYLVTSLYMDQQGEVWVGTTFGGLNRFLPSTNSFDSYTSEDGLSGEMVACILEDEQGNLWLGTNRGLSQFAPQEEIFYNYDSQDGLQEGEFISCTNNRDGELYFGGLRGLNAFYPQEIQRNERRPPVVISQVYLFNQPFGLSPQPKQRLQFSYLQNFLAFDFAALDFHAPGKNKYAYKLEGLDQEWNEIGSRRYADYPDLKPGEYTFRVIASNNDGVWNEEGASVQISIQPPLWQTNWFQLAAAIMIAGAVYGGYRLQIRRLRDRSQALEAEVAARTQDLKLRTREAEQRQAELEALYRADEELYRYLNLDHVLNALLDTAQEIMNADKALLVIWDDDRASMEVYTQIGFQASTTNGLQITPGVGHYGAAGVSGVTAILEDTTRDPGFPRDLIQAEHIHTSVVVPIKIDATIFGVFSVDYVERRSITVQEQRLLEALAQRTAIAIENARLYEQAQALAALEERTRIARDLHDSVTQTLFGTSMFADTAENLLSSGDYDSAAEVLSKLSDTARKALAEMRLLIYELRPPLLEKEGLASALISRLDTVEKRAGIQTELEIEEISGLSPDEEQQIYSIAIEALNNILKHAEAEHVSVTLMQKNDQLLLEIKDDGVGFDSSTAHESGGLGIHGMEERAAGIGAQLKIQSEPGFGTQLTLIMEIQL